MAGAGRPFAAAMCSFMALWLAASSPSTFVSAAGRRARSHVASIVTEEMYNASFFIHKDDAACPARNFYAYSAFVRAAERHWIRAGKFLKMSVAC
uniref:Glycoside hydrolase family 19 catalytic domain-containing protein n=1 Tax=Oryza brachyantha TaxID=4533 RepID=J3M3T1_ORYBR